MYKNYSRMISHKVQHSIQRFTSKSSIKPFQSIFSMLRRVLHFFSRHFENTNENKFFPNTWFWSTYKNCTTFDKNRPIRVVKRFEKITFLEKLPQKLVEIFFLIANFFGKINFLCSLSNKIGKSILKNSWVQIFVRFPLASLAFLAIDEIWSCENLQFGR